MSTDFALSLKIETVGAKEALDSLNLLDKKGRQIVDDAAGATGRAMGDIASAYTRGSASVRNALENIAEGHRENIAVMEQEGATAETLERRQSTASVSATRGLEQIARTGQMAGRSLDTILAQVSQIAFGFGPTGAIVGAISIATVAIVDLVRKATAEAKKLTEEVAKDFERIASMDVRGQGAAAQTLYGGDQTSADPYKRAPLKELQRLKGVALREQAAGTFASAESGVSMSDEAEKATTNLKALNEELRRRNDLLTSVMGPGGTFGKAARDQIAADAPEFTTAAIKAAEQAAKEAARAGKKAWDEEVKQFARGVKDRQRSMKTDVKSSVETIVENYDLTTGSFGDIIPTKEQMHEALRMAGIQAIEAVKNDPFLEAGRALERNAKQMARHLQDTLSRGLGDALANAFTAALSGKGVVGAIKAFGASILDTIGSFAEQLGGSMIVFGGFLAAFVKHVQGFDGFGAIAAGVGLVAAGAALRALASSFGGGASSGVASGGSSAGPVPSFLSFGVHASSPTTSLGAPAAREAVTFNIFGPADPKAQRAIAEAWNEGKRRGLVNA